MTPSLPSEQFIAFLKIIVSPNADSGEHDSMQSYSIAKNHETLKRS
jgi:hypothetical protein